MKSVTVTAAEAVVSIELQVSSFPVLGKLAGTFEKIIWHNMRIYWKPAVGTTYGGLVTLGVDWNSAKLASSRSDVAAYTPSSTCAVWSDMSSAPLVLSQAKLMTRKEFIIGADAKVDRGPGTLVVGVSIPKPDTVTLGEIWISYSATLSGTTA